MSGSDWDNRLAPVAVGGFCLLAVLGSLLLIYAMGSLNGKQAEQRHAQPHRHAETAKDEAKRACVGADPAAVFECVYDKVEASEDTARTEQDLTAQQRAAWAALIGAAVSAFALAVTTIGLWFVNETLKATRATVREARAATRATEQGVAEARKAHIREQRAYVGIVGAWLHPLKVGEAPAMYIKYKNAGATPARKLKISLTAYYVPYDANNTYRTIRPQFSKEPVNTSYILAGETNAFIHRFPITLPANFMEALQAGYLSILVAGLIAYKDIFGVTRRTVFLYQLRPEELRLSEESRLGPAKRRNHAT